jgi:hypothetical protein
MAATLAVGMAGAVGRGASEGTLLSNATPVPGTKGRAGPFFWVGVKAIVSLPIPIGSGRPLRINAESGETVHLPAIPAQYANSLLRNSFRLSPDGKRLLWGQQGGGMFRWIEGDMEAGTYFARPYQPYDPVRRPSAEWLPDGSAWMELSSSGARYALQVNTPLAPAHARKTVWWPNRRVIDGLTDPAHVLRLTPDRRAVVMVRQPMSYWGGEMAEIDLRTGRTKKATVPLPGNMGALGVALSPDGTRLAMTLWSHEPSSGYRLLGPLLNGFGIRDQRTASLRVVEADGKSGADVGTLFWTADRSRWRRGGLWHLKWTPDSRRISFAYRDQIYTVPAH